MLSLLLAACIAQSAGADAGTTDAPRLEIQGTIRLDSPEAVLLDVRKIKTGDPAPGDGLWMDEHAALTHARGKRACEHERAALRESVGNGSTPFVALVGAFVLGGATSLWIYSKLPTRGGSP